MDIESDQNGVQTYSSVTLAFIGALFASPLVIYYYLHHDTGRALLTLVAAACLMFIVSARWELRKFRWFWVTIAAIAGINIALIMLLPAFSSKGIRGPVLVPLGWVFGGFDYVVVAIVKKRMETRISGEPRA